MKAAICRTFNEPLVIEDLTLAAPAESEIRVKVKACAICHSDLIFASGNWGGEPPYVFGHEAAGIVEEIGPNVENVVVGDHVVVTLIRACGRCSCCEQGYYASCEFELPIAKRVMLTDKDGKPVNQGIYVGGFAEEATVHATQAVAIPKSIPFASASLLACGVITGLGAVTHTAKVPIGATVAVIGCGGVGLSAIQGARLSRAGMIVAIDVRDDKLEAAKYFGATHGLNSRADNLMTEVTQLTGGRGFDYVFVTVGAKTAFDQSYELLAAGGAAVLVGMAGIGVMTEFEQLRLSDLSQRILGSKMGNVNIHTEIPRLVTLYQNGELMLDEMISGEFPLEQINQAMEEVIDGSVRRNVIVFD